MLPWFLVWVGFDLSVSVFASFVEVGGSCEL
jgi:hypothetical protein